MTTFLLNFHAIAPSQGGEQFRRNNFDKEIFTVFHKTIKLNPVEAETTKSNESDNFLPVAREADLSTGPT